MRTLAINRKMDKRLLTILFALTLALTLTGCGDTLLERSYSSVVPHSAAYWENEDADMLRAENYQDLVNALMLLLGEHTEEGVVRLYGEHANSAAMASDACMEVQQETALGAYLLDYITYSGKGENGYYELAVHFRYRRTAEEQAAVVNATSTEALPDLLRAALSDGRDALAVRIGWLDSGRDGVLALVSAVHDEVYPPAPPEPEDSEAPEDGEAAPEGAELPEDGETPQEGDAVETTAPADFEPDGGEETDTEEAPGETGEPTDEPAEPAGPVYDLSPWRVQFYPDNAQPGIVEVILNETPGS